CLLDFLLTDIARHEAFGLAVIPDRHSAPAHSAHHQTLKQGRPFPGWTAAPVSTITLSTLAQPPDVVLILFPGNVTWVGVPQQNQPFVLRQTLNRNTPIDRFMAPGPAKNKGSGIAWIM